MEFLDKLISPQSSHHMVLIKYLLVLTYVLFVPYVSILAGSMIYSLYSNRKFKKSGNSFQYKFAKESIDAITFNKGIVFVLGFVPLLSSIFGYAQLLEKSGAAVSAYLFASLVFFVISAVLIYTYKYTFHIRDIFGAVNENTTEQSLADEAREYGFRAGHLNNIAGKWGLGLLLIAVYLFIAANQLALDNTIWSTASFWKVVFSLRAVFGFLQFLAVSSAVTSTYIFYRHSKEKSEDEYSAFIRHFALTSGLVALIIIPLMIVANLLLTPETSLSYSVFAFVVLAVLLVVIIANMFYIMIRNSSVRLGSAAMYLFVVLIGFLILKEQYAFDTTSKVQFAVLAANYDAYRAKLNEEMGIGAAPVSGADIYNGRCIACHAFDHKVVGPPYNSVLPKYEGKREALVKFILNPVKVNPDFPSMPNQGLKPNEAEAVAEYIMSTYKK